MPYTNAPTNDTYSSHRVPVVTNLSLMLDATPDVSMPPGQTGVYSGMFNMLPFQDKHVNNGELYAETIPNYVTSFSISTGGSITPIIRGVYVWEKTIGTVYYFVVTSNGATSAVYSCTSAGPFALVNTLGTDATTPVRFTEFIDATNTKKLVMVDGLEGYVFTSNAAGTKIVDADFPTPHVPFPVFIDGYLFLAKANTGDIYNSDLNDPASWTAGSFISSELYPDDIQALVKMNNYLLAIGTQGCEYFYDAANATASPLARQDGQSLPFGTTAPNSIAYSKDKVVLLATNNDNQFTIKLIEGFKSTDIQADAAVTLLSNLSTLTGIRGSFIRQNGSLFYKLYYSPAMELAYSLDLGIWSVVTLFIPFTAPPTTISTGLGFGAKGTATATATFGTLSQADTAGTSISQAVILPPNNFGTMNRKFMSRLSLVYAKQKFSNTQSIVVYTSDDIMQTFTTSPGRALMTIAETTDGFPSVTQLGQFRQRGFIIAYPNGRRQRWDYIEVDINKGQK